MSFRSRVALVAATVAAWAVVAPAASAPAIAAPSCAGVTVIVDFGHFGGAIERGCVSSPTSSLDALHDAGFSTAGTTQFGNAYVCRIDNLPSPDDEACVVTPPSNAYWGYYYAKPGDATWTFSAIGASSRRPPAGTIDAWAFGANARPRLTPAQVAPPPPPPPTSQVTSPPGAQGGPDPTTRGSGAGIPGNTTAPRSGVARPGATIVSPSSTAATPTTTPKLRNPTTTTDDEVRIVERSAANKSVDTSDSGSPLPVILTVVVVAALATGGFLVARQRRRSVP